MFNNDQQKNFDKEKQRVYDVVKRFIFELDDLKNEMLLINIIENKANIVYTIIVLIENFMQNANNSLEK